MLKTWPRRLLVALLALVIVFVIGFAAAVPPLLQQALEEKGTALLGRQVSVKSISANPFTLSVTLNGVAIADAPPGQAAGKAPMLAVERALISLKAALLTRRAAVFEK